MAKECTEPRNMANVQCRNCDEMGHESKQCPKPRDSEYSFNAATNLAYPNNLAAS